MAGSQTFQAENSEQFQSMQQHVETVRSYVESAKKYLPYLLAEAHDQETAQQINAHLDAINSLLEECLNDSRQGEIDKLKTAAKNNMDYQQYLSAYKLYETGQVRRALAKFKLLAQTTDDHGIKTTAEQSIQLIEGHDWGENGIQ